MIGYGERVCFGRAVVFSVAMVGEHDRSSRLHNKWTRLGVTKTDFLPFNFEAKRLIILARDLNRARACTKQKGRPAGGSFSRTSSLKLIYL